MTPALDVLSEIAHVNGQPLARHVLFTRRAWPATPRLQSLRTRFLHWATSPSRKDSLEAQELSCARLRFALQQDGRRETSSAATTARLIRRAKEFLEAQISIVCSSSTSPGRSGRRRHISPILPLAWKACRCTSTRRNCVSRVRMVELPHATISSPPLPSTSGSPVTATSHSRFAVRSNARLPSSETPRAGQRRPHPW